MAITADQQTRIINILVEETGLRASQVLNTVALLQEGSTVPFIARYRKEKTGELDEVEIRNISDRLVYFSELEERKEAILKSIEEQGKLTPELKTRIETTRLKNELEDLYLPYKPKRRTKATIAKERGLEPLAEIIFAQELKEGSLDEIASPFIDPSKDVPDAASALAGAGHIIAEMISEDADIRAMVRRLTWEKGIFTSKVIQDKSEGVSKYEMYYDYKEPLKEIPSHRMLAMRRGEKEEFLRISILAPEEEILQLLRNKIIIKESIFSGILSGITEDSYRRLIAVSIEAELRAEAKKKADESAIKVFAGNLNNLLLLPPAGSRRVLGIDPGFRTGSKIAAVDGTGKFLEHCTIYPHKGDGGNIERAKSDLLRMIEKHSIDIIAIGNGTAGREMDLFVKQTLREGALQIQVVIVNEAGASVYSASEVAREEFPDLDLTIRGAISIARRLQDPLAELVKIDPKSIGVGQYQHDVNQPALKKSLDAVVESCVNFVGVDLNTASTSLLSYISGIGNTLARAITDCRNNTGPFASRKDLLKVARFGAKAFEQSAGFLRIRNGADPLDNTAVHPEHYEIVKKMASDLKVSLKDLMSDSTLVKNIDLSRYTTEDVGMPTLRDITEELKKPGRDPRAEFKTAELRDDITEIKDLSEGMILQGTITNVTDFGAFVDIGVHQDGLVHISHLAQSYVKDPHKVVKVGQIVKVKVLSADVERKRISLSIKEAEPGKNKTEKKPLSSGENKSDTLTNRNAWEKAGFRVK
ncbi:MAG: RNA-binding transcriptional accessory protein [Candidatus Schekmanbacteria bacterium]|nr:RNA-binding transcriptional accessory protein [Candidatus Schekmanbacteria bacterium]